MSNKQNDPGFVKALTELKSADATELVDKFYALFHSITSMKYAELIAAKQTIDMIVDSRDFEPEQQRVIAHLVSALQTQAAIVLFDWGSSRYEYHALVRYFDLNQSGRPTMPQKISSEPEKHVETKKTRLFESVIRLFA